MKKSVIKEIVRFAITVLSAIGAAIGLQSCTITQSTKPESTLSATNNNQPNQPIEVHADVKYKD